MGGELIQGPQGQQFLVRLGLYEGVDIRVGPPPSAAVFVSPLWRAADEDAVSLPLRRREWPRPFHCSPASFPTSRR